MLQLRRIAIMLAMGATACLLGSQAYAWQQSPTHNIRRVQTHNIQHPRTHRTRHARTYSGGYYLQPRGGYYMQPPATYGMGYYRQPPMYNLAPGYSPPVTNCGMAGATCER